MHDFIPAGTGNSRYLKSVSTFLQDYPTYEDFARALISGTLPVDFHGKNAAGIRQAGTPLNKSNLLSDATGALLGLDSDGTVDMALNLIGNALGKSSNFVVCDTNAENYVKSVTVPNFQTDENGYPAEGTKLTILANDSDNDHERSSGRSAFKFLSVNSGEAVPIQSSGCLPMATSDSVDMEEAQYYSGVRWTKGQVKEFVFLKIMNTFPVWLMTSHSAFTPRLDVGYYTGTGTFSSSDSTAYTRFSLRVYPRLVLISNASDLALYLNLGCLEPHTSGVEMSFAYYFRTGSWIPYDAGSSSFPLNRITYSSSPESGGELTICHAESAEKQLNTSGSTYYFLALGMDDELLN